VVYHGCDDLASILSFRADPCPATNPIRSLSVCIFRLTTVLTATSTCVFDGPICSRDKVRYHVISIRRGSTRFSDHPWSQAWGKIRNSSPTYAIMGLSESKLYTSIKQFQYAHTYGHPNCMLKLFQSIKSLITP
jgi:hypothetical protein